MAAMTSIPAGLYRDKSLKDFDIRLYLFIVENTNEYGYTKIMNSTLEYFTGKDERSIRRALKRLIDGGWIVVKHNVKKNSLYDQDFARVIWIEEFYRKYDHRTHQEKKKTIKNDFKLFVNWLKTDLKGIPFPVTIGGVTLKYMIKDGSKNGKPILHVFDVDSQRWAWLDREESNDVYKQMFKKRSVLIQWALDTGMTSSMDVITKLANQKKEV